MVELKYKTKDNSAPLEKPRVYFCCHPKDFSLYFDSLKEEIFEFVDCSIWYLKDYEKKRDEKFFEDIKRMQLFVIPVTTEFLTINNPSFDIDFKFAVDNNIPVLPIMMEKGLVYEFNKLCGEIQFLDRCDEDKTSIRYEVKLEKYLNEVIGNAVLIEKIKAAFDAYVFLSYRKIDRVYADRLMRLVHKNHLCRDIAIWYDEFLIPGEDFNDSIKGMIERSQLFVLTVTPNVVGKIKDKNGIICDNYIIQEEYPTAKRNGIPVLPVEIISTDKNILLEKYEGLGECADGKDEKALLENVVSILKKIATKGNDDSPEHNFFIGLAYLNGIDVEIDHERALELIERAADSNLYEAAEKLAEIYQRGIGVKRDYNKSCEWFKKSVEIAHKDYIDDTKEESLVVWFDAIIKLGDYYSEYGEYNLAAVEYKKAIRYYELYVKNNSSDIKYSVAECCVKLGVALEKNYDSGNAVVAYEKGLRMFADLENNTAEQPSANYELQQTIFIYQCQLGDVYLSEGDLPKAEKIYIDALKKVENRKDVWVGDREKALIYGKIGDLYYRKIDYKNAEIYYGKKYEIFEKLHKQTKLISDKREYISAMEKLSDVWMVESSIIDASEFYGEAEKNIRDIISEASTLGLKVDLARIYNKFANFYHTYNSLLNKNTELDYEYYDKSYKLCTELIAETELLSPKIELANSMAGLARAYFFRKDHKNSEKYSEESMKVLTSLKNVDSTVVKLEVADGCLEIANIFLGFREMERSKKLLLYGLNIYRELISQKCPFDVEYKYAMGLYSLAQVYLVTFDMRNLPAILEKSIELIEKLLKKTSDERVKDSAVKIYELQGDSYMKQEKSEENKKKAHDAYYLAIKNLKKIIKANDNSTYWEELAIIWCKISWVSGKEHKKCLKKSLEIFEMLASKHKNEKKYQENVSLLKTEILKGDADE